MAGNTQLNQDGAIVSRTNPTFVSLAPDPLVGAAATSFANSLATTNATSLKATAGTLWSVYASNVNAAVRYLKLYNKASAPTVGTDTPVLVIPLPATGVANVNFGVNGLRFPLGIAWALTTGAADTDVAAVAANEIKVSISYT